MCDGNCGGCEMTCDMEYDQESSAKGAEDWWLSDGFEIGRELAASAWYCSDAVRTDAIGELAGYLSEETDQHGDFYLNPYVNWIHIASCFIDSFYDADEDE